MSATAAGVLLLRLEGPLQAWGEDSKWSMRNTRLEPTKSGVIGLLAACMGWGAADDALIGQASQVLSIGVRADKPGTLLRDYHTIVGGVVSAEGKVKINQKSKLPETVISLRDYLADACFLVAVRGPADLIDQLHAALLNPAWPPFLGRKSCVPAAPVFPAHPGLACRLGDVSLIEALSSLPWLPGEDAPASVRAVVELEAGQLPEGSFRQRRHDMPLSLAGRRFGFRYVYEMELSLPQEAGACT